MTHVVMFHIGRSGSTVLGDMLGQHSHLHWQGEVYLPIFLTWAQQHGRNADGQPIDPITYLAGQMRQTVKPIFGFEVKFFHLQKLGITLPDYLVALDTLGVTRTILLRRRNTLRKVVSSLVAHQNGQYHLAAAARPSLLPITLDVNRVQIDFADKPLLAFLADYEASWQQLAAQLHGRDSLHLVYETDILPGPTAAYRRVCDYMGIPPDDPEVHYGRTNPFRLEDLLLNFAEVAQALAGTPFAWMLYE